MIKNLDSLSPDLVLSHTLFLIETMLELIGDLDAGRLTPIKINGSIFIT